MIVQRVRKSFEGMEPEAQTFHMPFFFFAASCCRQKSQLISICM